jgi:hypothetical protein
MPLTLPENLGQIVMNGNGRLFPPLSANYPLALKQ